MADFAYFNCINSESAFEARFKAEEGKLFSEVHHVAASEWGRDHLFACRVIRRETQYNILPILSEYVGISDLKSSPEISAFLRGPDSTYLSQSEHGLVRDSGCSLSLAQIWAAMRIIKSGKNTRTKNFVENIGCESEDESHGRAKRPRRSTLQEDFIDSSMLQVGSSSPQADSFSSHAASSIGYIDRESHMLLSSPEDETLRLASCVIRHILYHAPPQDSGNLLSVIEFRDAKRRLSVKSPFLRRKIVATDDGGLCRRVAQDNDFRVDKERVAILEAKRHFQFLDNGRPIISDGCLAQMTCEALVARLADPFAELALGR